MDPLAQVMKSYREHLIERSLFSLVTPGYAEDGESLEGLVAGVNYGALWGFGWNIGLG